MSKKKTPVNPANADPLYKQFRLKLSGFINDLSFFANNKDEQAKADGVYRKMMTKEKELMKGKSPMYTRQMPEQFDLPAFTARVTQDNTLTAALKQHFGKGATNKAAWEYITLKGSIDQLEKTKTPENRDCGVTSAQTSFRKCVFCDNNAVFFCYQCKAAFCQMCRANFHDKLPVSKDHSVKDLKSVNPSAVQLVCSEHKAEYTYYCVSCNTLVCSTCVTTAHTGHEMSEIKRKAEEIKKIARSKLFNMREKLQRLSKLVQKTKSVHIPNVDEESEDAITSIRTIENDLHNIIKTKADIKTNEIEDKQHWTKEELQSTYHNNNRTFHKQTAVCDSLATLLSEEHAVSFLVSYQTLERDLYELTGEIFEDTEPKAIKPPDLVDFLNEIVYSIEGYKKSLKTGAAK